MRILNYTLDTNTIDKEDICLEVAPLSTMPEEASSYNSNVKPFKYGMSEVSLRFKISDYVREIGIRHAYVIGLIKMSPAGLNVYTGKYTLGCPTEVGQIIKTMSHRDDVLNYWDLTEDAVPMALNGLLDGFVI